ncbi:hypothetical protein GDO81_003430 [Engystomops pustulosus]|uniref:Uncharacterized protein n=1 Tax=Engystomops pustulosus TaxID=76066 RepID=A0AAV6ZVZ5_ENGPU|nr:hypothetical protein GDO81_003430 [Engystomops pustulosus]
MPKIIKQVRLLLVFAHTNDRQTANKGSRSPLNAHDHVYESSKLELYEKKYDYKVLVLKSPLQNLIKSYKKAYIAAEHCHQVSCMLRYAY